MGGNKIMSTDHLNGNETDDKALRDSELSYRRLFEAARDGIVILDMETGRISDVNQFLVDLLGFSHGEMVGKTVGELSCFRDIESNMAILEPLRKDGYVRYENLPLETRDGRQIAVEFVSNVYQAGDKKVIQCNIRDITERRWMETALIRFRSIIESSDDAIMGKDMDGIITSWNKGAEKIFGYRADEIVGTSIMRLIPDDRRDEESKILEKIHRGEGLDNLETLRQTKDGKLIDVSVTVCPIKDINGKVIGVSKVAHDITVRKEHEREIERLSRLYAALSQVNQAIVTLNNREEFFAKICRVLVEIGKLRMAWVGWLNTETRQVIQVAQFGDSTNYLSQTTVYADDRTEGQGPTGTAILEERNYICNDFIHEPRFLPWRKAAEQASLRSSAAFIIRQGGVICGAITVYAAGKDFFQDREIALLEEAAVDTSFALDNFVREEARRQAEIELRWKTAFLEAQVDSTLDGILVVDDKGKKILQNQRMNELWKIPPEIAGNKDASVQVKFVTDRTKSAREFANKIVYLNSHPDEVSRDEIELIDGAFLDRYSSPVRDKAGNHYGRIWTFRDITERKRIEARFRRLVDSNVQAVFFWNTKGEIMDGNNAFLKLAGQTQEDLEAGRINWMAMKPEYVESDQKALRALKELAETGICEPYEKEWIRKDGSRVPILLGAAMFEDNPEEGVCFVLDLTERKKLEQHFLRAQRMESIGTLAGGIAHDLNNVLAPITMSIDLLKMRFTDEGSQELLAALRSSAQRGAEMVRQVLSFARGVEGRKMDVQVKHILQDIGKIANDTFPKNIQVRSIIPNDLWTVVGDPTQLHQVLLNLCVNARDAMPSGGILTISAENVRVDEHYASLNVDAHPGAYVILQITDTGAGMPPAVIEKIFDPFFTTKEVGKGTGLGLSTSLAIVKSHGGFIGVYSEVGKGTTFKAYFTAQTEASAEAEAEIAADLPRGNGELILVVDDEASVRQITRKTLEGFGYRVVVASDGAEAVAAVARHGAEIAVVLTDMMMPVMDGLATIQVLHKLNPELPIIAASGLYADGRVTQAGSLGVRHFLSKPYSADALLQVLQKILCAKSSACHLTNI
jgi:PAS domain S-box-containing protein